MVALDRNSVELVVIDLDIGALGILVSASLILALNRLATTSPATSSSSSVAAASSSSPPPTSSSSATAPATISLRPEFYYALFRAFQTSSIAATGIRLPRSSLSEKIAASSFKPKRIKGTKDMPTKFHDAGSRASVVGHSKSGVETFNYEFENFFHPFVGKLIARLNSTSVAGMLDPGFLTGCASPYDKTEYSKNPNKKTSITPTLERRAIDVGIGGPYANYNWELLYHIPVTVAVNLSNNQRFPEAQKWFHLVFDPTNADTTVATPKRFWKSFVFSDGGIVRDLNSLLQLLDSTDPSQASAKAHVLSGYDGVMANPFDPFVVARSRPSAFQWYVVMKYLDNLIAWGDSLFLQDTIETINEATLCYVLAANILGPKPQSMPQPDASSPRNFRQLKQAGLDAMSNALVNLEAQFPFNLAPPPNQGGGASSGHSGALFGIGRSLFFCVPQNQTLLAYWDTVADRLFKIRNSENIQGVVQQLPLFDPPLDPGMLVKAAAAGIDIGSVVSGLNQPIGPMRSLFLIQKAQELAGEVRSLGNALLSALEKGDAERLAVLRETHEIGTSSNWHKMCASCSGDMLRKPPMAC